MLRSIVRFFGFTSVPQNAKQAAPSSKTQARSRVTALQGAQAAPRPGTKRLAGKGEPAMAGMLAHAGHRMPPAAASPGLPPVDPVVAARSEPATAGFQPSFLESPLPRTESATPTGQTPPQTDLLVRQGVAFAAKLNPSAPGPNPCAEASSPGGEASAQEGLAEGFPSRNFDGELQTDEPHSPFQAEVYEHSTFVPGKENAADPSCSDRSPNTGDAEAASSSETPPNLVVDSHAGDRLPRASKPAGPAARVPPRVADRPRMEDWADDELLTLPEAAALFWPDGPITTNTLRTAGHQGTLAITKVAGKFFTTPMAVRRMGADDPVPAARAPETVPDVSAAALFQLKLAEAKRLGRERARPKRAAERPVAPPPKGKAGQ